MIDSESEARGYIGERAGVEAIAKLELLERALRAENERQNLVSRGSLDEVWVRHFADSVQLLDHVPRGTPDALDLGSGAGFPGLVIAIARPETSVLLVESRARRIDWLGRMIDQLDLKNCSVEGSRLELLPTRHASLITARAFAPLGKLLSLSARFSTSDTLWVLPKGRSARQEVHELPRRRREMFHVEQSLTDKEAGIVVGKGRVDTAQ